MSGEDPRVVEGVLEPVPGIFLVGTVQGLVREADRVRAVFERIRPRVVALGVSPGDVDGLAAHLDAPVESDDVREREDRASFDEMSPALQREYALGTNEDLYAWALGRFGDVSLPPPDLLEAVRLARATQTQVVGVDLGEDAYGNLWSREVGLFTLFRYSRVMRRLEEKPPEASSAEEFALAWDAKARSLAPLARIEAAREAHMGERLRELGSGPILAVVEVARLQGVAAGLAR